MAYSEAPMLGFMCFCVILLFGLIFLLAFGYPLFKYFLRILDYIHSCSHLNRDETTPSNESTDQAEDEESEG